MSRSGVLGGPSPLLGQETYQHLPLCEIFHSKPVSVCSPYVHITRAPFQHKAAEEPKTLFEVPETAILHSALSKLETPENKWW